MRAALYARLSSSDDEANLEQQIERGRAYAQDRGWTVAAAFTEPKVSGFKERIGARPQGARLLAAIEAGEVDVVVVRDTDRLSRSTLDLLGFRQFCHVAAYSQGVDTTRGDRLSFGMTALLAEEESRVKSDRQRAYRARAAAAGRPRVGGTRPWGFEPDGVTPREDEQALIRESARDVASGASLRSVRRAWEAARMRTKNGTPVRQNTIRGVLLRADQYGVDPDTARRVSDILQDPSRRQNRSGENRRLFPLNGLTFCAECGRPMYGTRATRQRVPYYRCSGSDGGCGVTSIQAAKLEDEVWHWVIIERGIIHHDAGVSGVSGDGTTEARDALAALEARAANVRRDYATGAIDPVTLKEALAVIEAQSDALRRELADAAAVEAARESRAGWVIRHLPGPEDYDEARALVRAVIERVEVRKTDRNPQVSALDRISITWRAGRGFDPKNAVGRKAKLLAREYQALWADR